MKIKWDKVCNLPSILFALYGVYNDHYFSSLYSVSWTSKPKPQPSSNVKTKSYRAFKIYSINYEAHFKKKILSFHILSPCFDFQFLRWKNRPVLCPVPILSSCWMWKYKEWRMFFGSSNGWFSGLYKMIRRIDRSNILGHLDQLGSQRPLYRCKVIQVSCVCSH